jgi:phage shock protein A
MVDMAQPPADQPIDAELVDDATAPVSPPVVDSAIDYDQAGVPTFDYVRDRIEQRTATSIGAQELADATPEGHAVEDQYEARERAGRDKLEEIRRQMRGE